MDFHVLIVIACVFLASLFSLLFINKFFRGKTFEEVAAEKKLLAEKLYGPSKTKRQQRKVSNKKEIKKEKRQKEKEKSKETDADSHNESDAQSDTQSMESSPSHKKPHVEFSEPEIIGDDDSSSNNIRRSSSTGEKAKAGKRKVSNSKPPGSGILINKSETVLVKETPVVESLNNFEIKQPKDVLELKKHLKEENVENKKDKDKEKVTVKDVKKLNKTNKKEQHKESEKITEPQTSITEDAPVIKEIKKAEEKQIKNHDSPKNQNKQKKDKKKSEQPASILDKLDGSDVIGVNCLMSLFNRAELNRSEIQMLIDYLLNKQQDTLANHSEWSDDIVQKLKKQLAEKDKALQEEQEASIGIQAKLRDLRTEINTERVQYSATIKACTEEMQTKKVEIHNLTQEIQNLTEKINLERQQFQAKLRHEKQTGSQELLSQIQQLNERNNILQSEIVQKNSFINELQMITNASHQAVEETKAKLNEIIQQQLGQIHALEQNLKEAENTISRQQYDLELSKMVEKDKENSKVEIRNLQNALDSTKSELNLSRNEISDGKQRIEVLTAQIEELTNQITSVNNKFHEQTKETNDLRNTLASYKSIITEKDEKLAEYEISLKVLTNKEDELMKQIREQKEKNNELRTKNWKLVEALQSAEAKAVKVDKKHFNSIVHQPLHSASKEEQNVRELFGRLFPEAAKATAGSALSVSFDQWIEQVVATHIKQHAQHIPQQEQINNSKIQEISDSNSHNHKSSTQSTNHNHLNSNEECSDSSNGNESSTPNLILQNAQLRAHIEELTAIVTRTENMLTHLETQAREQDAYWRNVVQSKQEEINLLKNSNGQAI